MMNFSIHGVKESNFTLELTNEILQSATLIADIKQGSLKDGSMAFNKVIDIISEKIKVLDLSSSVRDCSFNKAFNLAYIFPDVFLSHKLGTSKFYLSLSFDHFTQIISRKLHASHILINYLRREDWRRQEKKILCVLFKIVELKELNKDQEIELLKDLSARLLNDSLSRMVDNTVKSTIDLRLANLTNVTYKPLQYKKVALIIAGQLRGYREAIPSIVNSFLHKGNVDVYVSTWDDIGHGKISPERIPRFFDEEALNYLRSMMPEHKLPSVCEELVNKFSNIENPGEIRSYFYDSFKEFSSIYFNSFNDRLYPFNRMGNSEKMYFHNTFWIETLGKECFSKYDLIIKIRPDLKLHEGSYFDSYNYQDGKIYVETPNGWMFMDWGFGIGDQIISGLANKVIDVLQLHGRNKLPTKLFNELHGSVYNYSGHRNCGYAAYLKGCDCEMTPVRPAAICNVKKYNITETMQAIKELDFQ